MNIAPQELWAGPTDRRVMLRFEPSASGLHVTLHVNGVGSLGIEWYFDADGQLIEYPQA